MVEYGYIGGSNLITLGSREYVQSFFKAIDKYVFNEELYRRLDWSLITDRLYKRTISDDALDQTLGVMARLMDAFSETPLSAVDWNVLGIARPNPMPISHTKHEASLRDLYLHFAFGLAGCASSAKIHALEYSPMPPLRIGLTTVPQYIVDEHRPVEAYEALGPNDPPFWLRDDIDYPEIPVVVIDGNNPE